LSWPGCAGQGERAGWGHGGPSSPWWSRPHLPVATEPRAWGERAPEGLESTRAADLTGNEGAIRGIRFLTPLKLKEGGEVLGEVHERALLSALERRVKGLCKFYGEGDMGHPTGVGRGARPSPGAGRSALGGAGKAFLHPAGQGEHRGMGRFPPCGGMQPERGLVAPGGSMDSYWEKHGLRVREVHASAKREGRGIGQ
jgi:hypothetical protein